jgi:pimeloyl-ACP methyl ester carboxylesterase
MGTDKPPAIDTRGANGEWFGELLLPDDWQLLQVHLEGAPGAIKGTLDVPYRHSNNCPLRNVRWGAPDVSFGASTALGELEFSGTLSGGELRGLVTGLKAGGPQVPFRLAHVAKVDFDAYTGGYEANDGRLVTIAPWTEQSSGFLKLSVQFNDTLSRRSGSLFPLTATRFVSGGPVARLFPVELDVTFETDPSGKVTGLVWRESGSQEVRARKIDSYRVEPVKFKNKHVTLAGTLVLPPGQGSHPAIVLTHGSGPQRRWRGIFEQLFARRGVAVLSYDKRGVGQSTGDWYQSSFEDLADDAVAGARYLQARGDIDPKRIGFFGLSQGGWIAPLAAHRFGEAAYVVAVSGGALTPERQELLDTESELRDAKFSEADIAEALEFQNAKNSFMRTGGGWEKYQEMRRVAVGKKWYGFGNTDCYGPASKNSLYWKSCRLIYFYDPAPTLQSLRSPCLIVCGALDDPKAVGELVKNFQSWLRQAGNQDVTIKVFPNSGHNLVVEEPDSKSIMTKARLRYTAGYLELLESWVARHAGTAP